MKAFTMNRVITAFAGMLLATTPAAKAYTFALGTPTLMVGPVAGTNGIVLAVSPETNSWTASANVPWLHLAVGFQSGTGSTNLVFSVDANPGATRSGTLTIAGQTLTLNQAGSTYVEADLLPILPISGFSSISGLAEDSAGNLYIVSAQGTVQKWTPSTGLLTTLVSSNLLNPGGVAADSAGNVYIADTGNNAIKMWTATNGLVTTLISAGLSNPGGVSV